MLPVCWHVKEPSASSTHGMLHQLTRGLRATAPPPEPPAAAAAAVVPAAVAAMAAAVKLLPPRGVTPDDAMLRRDDALEGDAPLPGEGPGDSCAAITIWPWLVLAEAWGSQGGGSMRGPVLSFWGNGKMTYHCAETP